MRAFALGLIFSAVAVPCLAQTVLKSEPLMLAPYEIAFVQDASCPAGKVLKVTGAIRGLHRQQGLRGARCGTGLAGDRDAVRRSFDVALANAGTDAAALDGTRSAAPSQSVLA